MSDQLRGRSSWSTCMGGQEQQRRRIRQWNRGTCGRSPRGEIPWGMADPSPILPSSVDAHQAIRCPGQQPARQQGFRLGGNGVPGTPPTCRTTTGTFEPDAPRAIARRCFTWMSGMRATPRMNPIGAGDAIGTSGTQLGRGAPHRVALPDPPDDLKGAGTPDPRQLAAELILH